MLRHVIEGRIEGKRTRGRKRMMFLANRYDEEGKGRCLPTLKGELNPNFLNLTRNREKILALETFWSHFLTYFC